MKFNLQKTKWAWISKNDKSSVFPNLYARWGTETEFKFLLMHHNKFFYNCLVIIYCCLTKV